MLTHCDFVYAARPQNFRIALPSILPAPFLNSRTTFSISPLARRILALPPNSFLLASPFRWRLAAQNSARHPRVVPTNRKASSKPLRKLCTKNWPKNQPRAAKPFETAPPPHEKKPVGRGRAFLGSRQRLENSEFPRVAWSRLAPDTKERSLRFFSRNSTLTFTQSGPERSPSPKKVEGNYGPRNRVVIVGAGISEGFCGPPKSSRENPGKDHFVDRQITTCFSAPVFYKQVATSGAFHSQPICDSHPRNTSHAKRRQCWGDIVFSLPELDKNHKRVFVIGTPTGRTFSDFV